MAVAREDVLERLQRVLSRHSVPFAMLFGSAARGDGGAPNDIDLAVEFGAEIRESGYSDRYLCLLTDLERTLEVDVDLVPIDAMPSRFAHVAFETGVVVVGTEARREELAKALPGEYPSTTEARERVAAVSDRLSGGESRSDG